MSALTSLLATTDRQVSTERLRHRLRDPAVLAVIGLIASCLAVVGGGQTLTPTTALPTTWGGVLVARSGTPAGQVWGLLLSASLGVLVVLWLGVVAAALRGEVSERNAWRLSALWALPFVIGPPILSKDAYAYVAQGIMAHHGLDPYTNGPEHLDVLHTQNADIAREAVDPRWRASRSPYGPIATLIVRLAATVCGDHPVATILVLRLAAVAAIVGLGFAAAALGRPRRALAVVLVVLNPVVLVHAVSGVHFEAEMGALVVAGVLAATRRHPVLAVITICAAGSVKATAFAALPIIVAAHMWERTSAGRPTLATMGKRVGQDVAVAAVTSGLLGLIVPNGFGWIHNLGTPGQTVNLSFNQLIARMLHAVTPPSWYDAVTSFVAGGLLVLGFVAVAYYALTARRRPVAVGVGLALVVLAFVVPVFYPWYLLWGITSVLVVASPPARDCLLAICGFGTIQAVTGNSQGLSSILDVVAIMIGFWWLWSRHVAARVARPARAVRSGVDLSPYSNGEGSPAPARTISG